MIEDPFATVEDTKPAPSDSPIRGGRYRLPDLTGEHHKGGWQRVSNLVAAYSDQYALRGWERGQMLQGMRQDHALVTALLDATDAQVEDTSWTEEFLERCKTVAGGAAGAAFGNQRHDAVEVMHAGGPTHHFSADTRRHLELYRLALARHGLVALPGMQERIVLVASLEACGRLDNILTTAAGQAVIGDLKTQKRFWTFLEVAAQLACYAHGDAMWDATTGTWVDMPKVSRTVGKALWMPRLTESGEPTVDVIDLDLVEGWETARLARQIVQRRASGKKHGVLAPALAITETERYAALFAAVDSLAEGRALVAEVQRRGLWSEMLADCARLAVDRLGKTVVR